VKAASLRELGPAELKAKHKELGEELFRLRLKKALGQLDNAVKVRSARRDIARINTILKEKSAAQAGSK
jgi:large subunit ribosomal protein L29